MAHDLRMCRFEGKWTGDCAPVQRVKRTSGETIADEVWVHTGGLYQQADHYVDEKLDQAKRWIEKEVPVVKKVEKWVHKKKTQAKHFFEHKIEQSKVAIPKIYHDAVRAEHKVEKKVKKAYHATVDKVKSWGHSAKRWFSSWR